MLVLPINGAMVGGLNAQICIDESDVALILPTTGAVTRRF